jgi:hypothetical protein
MLFLWEEHVYLQNDAAVHILFFSTQEKNLSAILRHRFGLSGQKGLDPITV